MALRSILNSAYAGVSRLSATVGEIINSAAVGPGAAPATVRDRLIQSPEVTTAAAALRNLEVPPPPDVPPPDPEAFGGPGTEAAPPSAEWLESMLRRASTVSKVGTPEVREMLEVALGYARGGEELRARSLLEGKLR